MHSRGIWFGSAQRNRGLFPKGLVLIFSFPFHYMRVKDRRVDWVVWWKCTTSAECQSKYLAVSPVTNNLSIRSRKTTEAPNIPTSEVKLDVLKRLIKTMVFKPYLSCCIQEKSLQRDREKSAFCKIALKLHQPNMHTGYRVIPLSVHQKSLARISWILTHSLQRNSFVAGYFWRVSFR